MSRARLSFHGRLLATTGGGGGSSSAVTYDTAIGSGVDANGFASLPLRAGATRYYVKPSTGSDANAGTNPTLPLATVQHAADICSLTAGDQILCAEGETFSTGFPDIRGISGHDPVYPFVVQSYDPADPTNEAKIGRATGTNRPAFNNAGNQTATAGAAAMKYIALRGLAFNMNSTTWRVFGFSAAAVGGTNDYILVENCIFHYMELSFEQTQDTVTGARANKYIVRNSAIYAGEQGIYAAYVEGLTIEDNVFWHNGWVVGAARTDASPPTAGGPSGFEHCLYIQSNCTTSVVRRNAMVDTASDGGNIKGGGLYQDNFSLRNPIGFSMGSGNAYSVHKPFGSWMDGSWNAVLQSNTQSDPYFTNGWAASSNDGRSAAWAKIHHNVFARNDFDKTAGAFISNNGADPDYGYLVPDNTNYDHNVTYQWTTGSATQFGFGTPATATNNLWDATTSGSNLNNGSTTFANAYTETTLLAALPGAYASETAAVNDWIANPEQHGWRNAAPLMLAGYGIVKAQSDLATDMRLTIGVPSTGMFIGTLDGYSLSGSGLPTGLTIESDGRRWIYDGTGSAASGTATITETNGTSSHNSSIAWAVYARPVLSSLSVTPSTTTATVNVSTDVGSGNIDIIADPDPAATTWPMVRAGRIASGATAAASASLSVSTTGAKTISLTGLTTGRLYHYQIAQLDDNHNPSLVYSGTFTTT